MSVRDALAHRPNPVGLHRVTVIGTEPPTRLHVDGLEAIDGAPILDPGERLVTPSE